MGRYTDEPQTDGRLNVAIPNLDMEAYIITVYMVERDLPGITLEQLGGAQKSAIETSEKFTSQGKQVRYIQSTYIPGESRVMCLFEASSPQLVEEVNQAANIPFTRVVEAMDLTP